MTSQEVNEYMHRFLDDDLSEEETALLMDHMMKSPASAAMFERLKRLNSDLEQLPKVTPPISIVDSILPRLEREGLWTDATTPAADIAAPAPTSERVIPIRGNAGNGRIRNVYKWTGGIAAAAIALTVFISTMMPGENGNSNAADNALEEAEFMAMNSAAADDSSAAQAEAPAAKSAGTAEESANSADSPAEEADNTVLEAPLAEPTQIVEPIEADVPAEDEAAVLSETRDVNGFAGEPAATGNEDVKKQIDEGNGSSEGGASIAAVPEEDGGTPEKENALPAEPTDADNSKSDSKPPIGSIADPASVQSPDQTLTASKEAAADGAGERIVITNVDGEVVFTSEVYAGKLQKLVWSEDSAQLKFSLVTEALTSEVTILVADFIKTEAK